MLQPPLKLASRINWNTFKSIVCFVDTYMCILQLIYVLHINHYFCLQVWYLQRRRYVQILQEGACHDVVLKQYFHRRSLVTSDVESTIRSLKLYIWNYIFRFNSVDFILSKQTYLERGENNKWILYSGKYVRSIVIIM